LTVVTLTFELLTSKCNQHIYEPKYVGDQNWMKFPSLVFAARAAMLARSWES